MSRVHISKVLKGNVSLTTGKRLKSKEKFPNDNSERPFFCESCGRGFYRLEHKKRHLKIHTGEKPYKCKFEQCIKSFSRSDELRRHSKIHISPATKLSPNNIIRTYSPVSSSENSNTTMTATTPKRCYKKRQSKSKYTIPLTPISSMTDIKSKYAPLPQSSQIYTEAPVDNNVAATLATLKRTAVLPSSNNKQAKADVIFKFSDSDNTSTSYGSDNEISGISFDTSNPSPPSGVSLTSFNTNYFPSTLSSNNILNIKTSLPPLRTILKGIEIFESNN
ncbi:hypothetical protein TPHA_0A05820 [Tetrapisispora phaffii CBS 4417]|uniref:C2H2-type domain-containing protein n=1 Tax=Tetrapisispora phaffii (strain ATCC 24235 / CBS 4417 / NBRC 1672 / NRRL Y-8282 / UCD 70-5) TaxID=1071381 RepID=G8BP28_TETPH|nr:hypothetical protein TPHA_0A05820 [Tetrapisispora phaffii CBS 4417]CCE61656.1 hypothetical protein TPHA_0A05820 [Tetrapisispora phaffii CBS 4417]